MSSEKDFYLNRLFTVITDPEKREFVSNLELDMLRLMVTWNLQSDQWTQLKTSERAYNIRSLYHRRAIDKESNRAIELEQVRNEFTSKPNYLPIERLLKNVQVLDMARRKLLNPHPQSLSDISSNYGVSVLGGIPNDDRVTLLIDHDQLIQTPDVSWPTPLRSEIYNIPKMLKKAELLVNGSSTKELDVTVDNDRRDTLTFSLIAKLLPTYAASIYFTMASLDARSKIWDVVFE